jgi:hypothetical protein
MTREQQSSEEDRQQLQLAKVERLRGEYLDAKGYFLRILADDKLHERGKAIIRAATARKVALSRYIAAAAEAAGEN